MDYREEQVGEIEALTSIYEGEIQGKHLTSRCQNGVCYGSIPLTTRLSYLNLSSKAIFPCPVLEESPLHVFTMPVKTEGYDPDDGDCEGLYVLLKFSYTEKYPEEAAVLEIEESDEAGEDGIVEELLEHLGQQVK